MTHLESQEPHFTKSRQTNPRLMVARVRELLTPQVPCVSWRDARHASKNALVLQRFLSISASERFQKELLAQTRLQTNAKEHKNFNYRQIELKIRFASRKAMKVSPEFLKSLLLEHPVAWGQSRCFWTGQTARESIQIFEMLEDKLQIQLRRFHEMPFWKSDKIVIASFAQSPRVDVSAQGSRKIWTLFYASPQYL